jgi:hypothetical protein
MALIKFIERCVVEKHRAIALEPRLVMHNHTWESERTGHIRTVQIQCHIYWWLLATLSEYNGAVMQS